MLEGLPAYADPFALFVRDWLLSPTCRQFRDLACEQPEFVQHDACINPWGRVVIEQCPGHTIDDIVAGYRTIIGAGESRQWFLWTAPSTADRLDRCLEQRTEIPYIQTEDYRLETGGYAQYRQFRIPGMSALIAERRTVFMAYRRLSTRSKYIAHIGKDERKCYATYQWHRQDFDLNGTRISVTTRDREYHLATKWAANIFGAAPNCAASDFVRTFSLTEHQSGP